MGESAFFENSSGMLISINGIYQSVETPPRLAKWKCNQEQLKVEDKMWSLQTSLTVQSLRLCAPTAGGTGWIPGQGRACMPHGQKINVAIYFTTTIL